MCVTFHSHVEFVPELEYNKRACGGMDMEYLTSNEIAVKWDISSRRVRKLCEEGFHERFDGRTDIDLDVYRKRFEYEFDVIKKMGFMDYHTITADFIQWAKDDKVYEHPRRYFPEDHYPDLNALPEKVWKKNYEILVGPGRGSAAGSLLCYCLKITNLDPIKDGLLFERFLNVERVSMPKQYWAF